ncbi:MAG: PLD nuclease N-terminal domain-containing protein [Geobacteraceae bacterium]|nr:PLD nuclease N-terminal domain-containing protein [Geobacteraceae bacterium]
MGFGVPELLVIFFLLGAILCIVALLDILRSEFTGYNKLVWLLAVIFFPLIGSLAYFVFGRKQKAS